MSTTTLGSRRNGAKTYRQKTQYGPQYVCNANMNNCSKPRPVQNRYVCKHAPRELTYEGGGGGGGGRGRKKYQVWGDVTVTPCETP